MENRIEKQLPLTRIQKLIGKLMLDSKHSKACGYLSVWTDVTELTGMRKQYCKKEGVRVTTNDFFLYAMARSIARFPLMAGRIDSEKDELVISENIGLGLAVAAPQGLVVPVIQKINQMTLVQVAQEGDRLLKRARANQLLPDDFEGANVVLSGLGMYGIEWFFAIAPPAATAIASIGLIEDQIVPMQGDLMVRKRINISLAVDHRIADDFYAASFLRDVADQLENPWSLTEKIEAK